MLHHARALPWPRLKQLAESKAVALLPIGSTEAHGPHLPLCVDVVIAEEVCRRLATKLQVEAVMFPAVAYSLTDFAAPFAGTISLAADTAKALLIGVIEGLVHSGFSTVAIVNHHLEPAHFSVVHAAAKEVALKHAAARIVVPDHRRKPTGPLLGDEFMHGGSHAGWYETSLMLCAAPELVNDAIRLALPENPVDLPGVIKAGAKNFLEAGGPEAYFGAPSRASAEDGERLFEIITNAALATLTTPLP